MIFDMEWWIAAGRWINRARLDHGSKANADAEDTLVIWGGEFGRTPMNENRNRDGFFLAVIIIRMHSASGWREAAWARNDLRRD